MQIGLWIDEFRPLPEVVEAIEKAAAAGFARAWIGERGGWDPLTVLAAVGDRAPGIGLGTAVTTTVPRHPLTLAAQALTTQAAVGNRLTLGIGPSHGPLVEGRYGLPWDRPGRHVREYVDVLVPVLAGREAEVHGEALTAVGGVTAPGATPPPLLLAAHGPRMLRLAGARADGVLTTWTTPRAVGEEVVPAVTTAAAGRPAPQVVAGVVASLTADPDGTRSWVAETFAPADGLPSYRDSVRRQGLGGVADTVIAGDEGTLEAAVRAFADAGATELQLIPAGPPADRERTIAFVASLAR
ncbi:TIGR03564 family F420-dependent LLM class oxidoreductase [Pseudonocardia sp. NPDC049154]|uniref:TIGR03564 family F420-dependent LLM class oxidoreductase n=1 Tax=Pseudonocardia sp. NPDC049154 TaxID=3155501 RepID=UPI0033C6BDD5